MERLSRRECLRMSAIVAASAVVTPCARLSEAPTQASPRRVVQTPGPTSTTIPMGSTTPVPTPIEAKEPPQLLDLVSAGTLPPLEERLPPNPLVVAVPRHKPGMFDGRHGRLQSRSGGYWQENTYGNSPIRWVGDGLGVDQGWLEEWEHNEDKSEWTLYLRKGIKWSDGEPFTVDDVLYWWEDMCLNPNQVTDPPDEALSGKGTLAEFTKVDDYTLVMSFDAPAPLTLDRLATWVSSVIDPCWSAPRHYMEQFHPTYNSAVSDYVEHDQMVLFRQNPDRPTLSSWMCVTSEPDAFDGWDRNPYYYCVDLDGNQLPYVNESEETEAQGAEARESAIPVGRADSEWHQPFQLDDVATPKANQDQSDLETRFIDTDSGTGYVFFFGQGYREDKYRELFRTLTNPRPVSHVQDDEEAQRTRTLAPAS